MKLGPNSPARILELRLTPYLLNRGKNNACFVFLKLHGIALKTAVGHPKHVLQI